MRKENQQEVSISMANLKLDAKLNAQISVKKKEAYTHMNRIIQKPVSSQI